MVTQRAELKTILLIASLLSPLRLWADDGIRVVSWPTPPMAAALATVGTVSVSNQPVTLLAARNGRLKVVLLNEKETLYIKAGTGVSTTDYTWKVAPGGTLEIVVYNGPLTAVLGVVGPTTVHVSDF